MIDTFSEEYLKSRNEHDLKRILAINEEREFPRCVGSWDCQHWQWKNCSIAWAGQLKGKENKPTIIFEANSDGKLWIWGTNFGSLGSMNDINVLDSSKIVEKIVEGKHLLDFTYKVNKTVC